MLLADSIEQPLFSRRRAHLMDADVRRLPGLDPERLAVWVETHAPEAAWTGPVELELIAGGKSNLTYRLITSNRSWIVRRPPLGHVLATAHDMAREYRVMSALQGTAAPVLHRPRRGS